MSELLANMGWPKRLYPFLCCEDDPWLRVDSGCQVGRSENVESSRTTLSKLWREFFKRSLADKACGSDAKPALYYIQYQRQLCRSLERAKQKARRYKNNENLHFISPLHITPASLHSSAIQRCVLQEKSHAKSSNLT